MGVLFSPLEPHNLFVAASIRATLRSGKDHSHQKSLCKLEDNVQCIAVRSDGGLLAVGSATGDILVRHLKWALSKD